MPPAERPVERCSSPPAVANARSLGAGPRVLDPDTRQWLHDLDRSNPSRRQALARLHQNLLRAELARRRGRHPLTGPELDDVAHQAAGDALVAITAKLADFRGESRFTTWAYKFVILEVSTKPGRHFWQRPTVTVESGDWDRLPDRLGMHPDDRAEALELVAALRRAVTEELTEHQRKILVALVVEGVPLDALVVRLGSNRDAIYRTMFDARRKLRAALFANGHREAYAPGGRHKDVKRVKRS